MKYLNFNIVIILAGLACGMSSLESAYASQPPIGWFDIAFFPIATLFGLPFVIGIQLFRSDPKYAVTAVKFFRFISIFLLASGVSAFAIELYKNGVTPQGVFFMALGSSTLIATKFCGTIAKIKQRKHDYQNRNKT